MKAKWVNYLAKDGSVHRVQGTWEFTFAQWLDRRGFQIDAHSKRIDYKMNGISHFYYPDFWVEEWCAFVDIKASFFHNKEKFAAIRNSNPYKRIVVLLKRHLYQIGVFE
jgi:hypothetical protein